MRLRKLKIKEYYALRDFTLDCSEDEAVAQNDYTLHLIVGVNGTGKSTLLRLLARLFLQLKNEQQRNPPFGFAVSYQIDEKMVISITNLDEDDNHLPGNQGLLIRHETVQEYKAEHHKDYVTFNAAEHANDLPPRVIAFTTGNEDEWIQALQLEDQSDSNGDESLFFDSDQPAYQDTLKDWYLQELPGLPVKDEQADNTQTNEGIRNDHFYFLSAEQIPLLTLCGMLVDINDSSLQEQTSQWHYLDNVMKQAKIMSLPAFSLRLRMNKEALIEPNKSFINQLLTLASRTTQTGSDYLLVFDLLSEKSLLQKLLDLRGGQGFLLFSSLARLAQASEQNERILQESNIFLDRSSDTEKSPLHLFTWLSDGEQSFLGRLCLMPLLRESEALILLDEPEVHFNDYWKQQLVFMLDKALQTPQTSPKPQPCHIFMTTHSSITLTDVMDKNILLLKRDNGYTHKTVPVQLKTLGADPSDIMLSVFGARNAAGANGVHLITKKLEQIRSKIENEQLPDTENIHYTEELHKLAEMVGPGYWRFLILRQIQNLEARRK